MKTYIDIGTNSMGGFNILSKELNIDDIAWHKIFIEPNPECHEEIEKHIQNYKNVKFYKAAASNKNGKIELITRNDMKGDSAATLLGLKFITDSIGSVNQKIPAYNKYIVDEIDFNDILDSVDSDEIYIKMDCEGKEYDILNNINEKHFIKIKKLYVEFHAHDEDMRNERDKIISEYYKRNIIILNWE
tara:strand:+ start:688 stop:1251 length:564 start_codon:yes stop_codon:yes gene_type:complete